MKASSGTARVFNRPAPRDAVHKPDISLQTFSLYSDPLTVRKNIRTVETCDAFPRDEIAERGRKYLVFCYGPIRGPAAGKLSGGGMETKIGLFPRARAATPSVLSIEPTTGVDPVSPSEFWDASPHLTAEGLTFLVVLLIWLKPSGCHRIAAHVTMERFLRSARL